VRYKTVTLLLLPPVEISPLTLHYYIILTQFLRVTTMGYRYRSEFF